jgi:hypothetical protein
MQLYDQLRALEAAQGELRALALAAVDLAYSKLSESQRQALKDALDAAAIPHWFDETILAAVLDVSPDDASARLAKLRPLRTVEHFPSRGEMALNVHEAARLALRRRLAETAPDRFRNLSANACRCFAHDPSPAGRIEWVFHLLSADPERGASELEALNRDWSERAYREDIDALAAALKELEDAGLVRGRARAWILLVIAWTRVNRGESAQLAEVANDALQLAQAAGDSSAEAEARRLLGDVLRARGQEVYVSYAWAQEQQDPLVEALCNGLTTQGMRIRRDSTELKDGDRISSYMERLSAGRCVVVVLSEPYLRSEYCMTELYHIYTNARQRDDFLLRIVPLVQDDAHIASTRERIAHAVYWKKEHDELEALIREHGPTVIGEEDFRRFRLIGEFYRHVSDMLAYVNDVLVPRDRPALSHDNFAMVKGLIERAIA